MGEEPAVRKIGRGKSDAAKNVREHTQWNAIDRLTRFVRALKFIGLYYRCDLCTLRVLCLGEESQISEARKSLFQ